MSGRDDADRKPMPGTRDARVLALCGGIGGAKLALGLYTLLAPGRLTIVVNTGDDFEHLGLAISPDLDTVMYTLAGLSDQKRGWGRDGETWNCMASLAELGADTWFQLGDRDLAIHIERTRSVRAGATLSEFTARLAGAFEVAATILPMSDDPMRTMVDTPSGPLAFQHYFVRERCEPEVRAIRFEGAETARLTPGLAEQIGSDTLDAILICPSNPYLSIDPILAVPGIRQAIARATAPVVAVSPIIGGDAVKGPTARIMQQLGVQPSNTAIAAHYAGLLDGLVIDGTDAGDAGAIPVPIHSTSTLMRDLEDRRRLAAAVLEFAARLRPQAARQPVFAHATH